MSEVAIDPRICAKPCGAANGAAVGRRASRLVAVGLAALALGLLVYLTDRPALHALLIPSYAPLSGHHLFGVFGQWLPSFVHPFAFSLLTAAALPFARSPRYGACLAWAGINGLFEVGQHPWLSGRIAEALHGSFGPNPVTNALARFFLHGIFDVGDLVAIGLGAAAAALVLARHHHRNGGPHAT